MSAELAILIPVSDDRRIDARRLHAFLETKVEFSHWIKNRIEEYGFENPNDFQLVFSDELNSIGKVSNRVDYAITIEMAKELCMVERTPKGREARLYFIECERRLAAISVRQLPSNDPWKLLRLAVEEGEKEQHLRLVAEAKAEEKAKEAAEAVRAKGQISSSREAKVMSDLGHTKAALTVVKAKVEELEVHNEELARKAAASPLDHYTSNNVRRMYWGLLSDFPTATIGRHLTALSEEMGFPTKLVPLNEKASVNGYRIDVVEQYIKDVKAGFYIASSFRRIK